MYVDAAYCYRQSSVVCRSVSLSVMIVSCTGTKMAEPIELPFGMWTRVVPRKYVVDGGAQCTLAPPDECN